MVRFEGGTVVFETTWTIVKEQINTRKLDFRFEEDITAYEIFAVDEKFLYRTVIYKAGQAPQNQATFDIWRIDFETNYKNRVVDFNNTGPVFISNIDGYSVVLKDGASPTANDGYGIALIGYDGSNYRMARTDSSGRQVLVGAGAPGTPIGGVISIQGVPGGQAVPVSGTVNITGSVTTTNASVGLNSATIPTSSTQIGGSDGTNLQVARVFDLDTGGGTQYILGVGLRKASGGGSVELGTSSDPIRTDPIGSTIQPVSGTVISNIGTTNGLALDTTLSKLTITQGSALGGNTQILMGASVAAVVPTYTTGNINPLSLTTTGALRVDGSSVTQPISGTVTANAGTGSFTVVQATTSNLRAQTSSESNTGSAIPIQASLVGGSDGTNLRSIFLDSSGRQIIIGAAANGVAVAGNPVLIAGSDGTNARTIRTATDGTIRVDPTGTTIQPVSGTITANQGGTWTVQQGTPPWTIVGPGAVGAAVSGNPVRMGGSDGTNTRNILTDTSGRQIIAGPVAVGAAVTGNPVLIGGSDGTNARLILTDNTGRLVVAPASSSSVLSGFSDGFISLNSNVLTALRSTTYNEQGANAQRSIGSNNAADDATPGGTGARTVLITYYTTTFTGPFIEIISLNGTSAVNTVATNIRFIESMQVLTAGSTGSNVGTITLFAGLAGAGGVVGTIAPTINKTFWSHHYVATGITCYITGFQCNMTGSQGAGFHIRNRSNVTNAVEIQISDNIRPNSTSNGAGSVLRTYGTPISVIGPSRITIFVKPDQAITADYYGSFDFYEQ